MEQINNIATSLGHFLANLVFSAIEVAGVEVQLIVLWLFCGMLFFTLRLKFINLRGFSTGIDTVSGKYLRSESPGSMTPFQSLTTALSGTVGLGNIAGVAIAISMGGPGAAFWMVVIGFFAMSLKFAEVLLSVKYRKITSSHVVYGGPMWYLSLGLGEQGFPRLGKWLAYSYAFVALFAFIQVLQINQSYSQIKTVIGVEDSAVGAALCYGLIFTILSGLVLVGGVRSVAKTTARLTPIMCSLYLLSVAIVLLINAHNILPSIQLIIADAFSYDAGMAGILGAFIAGMRRAVYSNEAGIGASGMAHAAAKTDLPASEGYVALLEPFVDTMVVCSATALLIVSTGVWDDGYRDIAMTSAAFATVSSWFPYMLAICVCIFTFSTVIAVGYYGQQICVFLFGESKTVQRIYLFIFCGLLPIGALADVSSIVNIIDSLFFILSIPNMIGLYMLTNVVTQEVARFKEESRGRAE